MHHDEINKDTHYRILTAKGNTKEIAINPEIEQLKPDIDKMTDIGKLTDLLWGFNVVDDKGMIWRKMKFLQKYPDKARLVIKHIYPAFFYMPEYLSKIDADFIETQSDYIEKHLKEDFFELTGFRLIKTAYLR